MSDVTFNLLSLENSWLQVLDDNIIMFLPLTLRTTQRHSFFINSYQNGFEESERIYRRKILPQP